MVQTTSEATVSYSPEKTEYRYGWVCPKCGRVNAPWMRVCDCSIGYSINDYEAFKVPTTDWKPKVTCNGCAEGRTRYDL